MRIAVSLRSPWLGSKVRMLHLSQGQAYRQQRRAFFEHSSPGSAPGPRSLTQCALPSYKLARKSRDAQRGSTFPFIDSFELRKGSTLNSQQVEELLLPFMGEERLERFDRVVANRTFNVLPIAEDFYDMGNLAAVFRSADALGFGAVHVIRSENYKQSKRASAGSEKWLDVQLWDNTRECLTAAKEMGYRIVAAHLSPDAVDIADIDWTQPTAFVLGNEKQGVSATTLEMADQCVKVGMVGFVESFNVSVAASLICYQARSTRLQRLGYHGDLSKEEQRILRTLMLLRNKGRTNEMVQQMLNRPPPDWQIYRAKGDWGGKFETPPVPRETRCHYWDGQQCYGEALVYRGKACTHSAGHIAGVNSLNKDKLRLMCEHKGLPLPAVLLPKGGQHGEQPGGSGRSAALGDAQVAQRQQQQQQQQQQLEERQRQGVACQDQQQPQQPPQPQVQQEQMVAI